MTKAVSEDKLPAVMKFLDWCNSEAGTTALNNGVEGATYWIHSDGYRYAYPEGEDENKEKYSNYNSTVQHSLNQLGMNVHGDLSPAGKTTILRSWYDQNLIDNAQYVISNPCFTLDSATNVLLGTTINTAVEDAQVQYIAGKIDLEGLQAVYADWHTQGGDKILEEYQALLPWTYSCIRTESKAASIHIPPP